MKQEITLREYIIDDEKYGYKRSEFVIVRDGLNLICPDKIRPCSSRCPFCHINENKVSLTCRANVEHFFLEERK